MPTNEAPKQTKGRFLVKNGDNTLGNIKTNNPTKTPTIADALTAPCL